LFGRRGFAVSQSARSKARDKSHNAFAPMK
jgi:hypothetical protein